MRWSWTLLTVRGIDIRIHAAFLLLLLWIGGSAWASGDVADALGGVGFAVVVFTIVVLHELGHAVVAARHGIRTLDITLLPIGGVARLERMPEEPRAELKIALAGPAVNVALAVLFGTLAVALGIPLAPSDALTSDPAPFLARLVWINVALATFNLLPAFPMDGGRILRALLAMRVDRRRATHIAASIGQGLALLLGFFGLFGNPLLVFIALFVWFGAGAESSAADLRAVLDGLRVRDVLVRNVEVLAPHDTLATASARVISGFQTHFPVLDDGRVVGMLGHADMIRGLSEHGPGLEVGAAMQPRVGTIGVDEPLAQALEQLERSSCPALPVLEGGVLVGLVTLESLGELLAVRSAIEASRVGHPIALPTHRTSPARP